MEQLSWDNINEVFNIALGNIKVQGVKGFDAHGFEYYSIDFGGIILKAYIDKNTNEWIAFDIENAEDYMSDAHQIAWDYLLQTKNIFYFNTFDVELALSLEEPWIFDRINRKGIDEVPAKLKAEVSIFKRLFGKRSSKK